MIPHYNPYNPYGYEPEIPESAGEDMSDEERLHLMIKRAIVHVLTMIVGMLIILAMCALFGSCTTTKYVPVTETHTEHHWHTDSVKERDSTHTERETVIREVDSAAMAKYGIQMQANQRAWLVLQREMENRLRELEHMTASRDTIRDSIPYPVEVTKEVPAELTWWQQTRLHVGGIVLCLLLFAVAWYIGGLLHKVKKKFLP